MRPQDNDRLAGRQAFGGDPAGYNASRPPYPDSVFDGLRSRAGLRPGIDILEIGAGAGLATHRLLAHDPARLVALEPDRRSTDFLQDTAQDPRLEIVNQAFEDADLPPETFDLVACATAFHWLDTKPSLQKIRGLLKPDGKLALWWNIFGDNTRTDVFHLATVHLFAPYKESLSAGTAEKLPYGLDVKARLAELDEAGLIADEPQILHWTLPMDASAVRKLYSTFSTILILPQEEQTRMLDALEEIARVRFGGQIERNMATVLYTAGK